MRGFGPARRVPEAGRPRALRLGFALRPGMTVGLQGGSFNPAHAGHAHLAEVALKRLRLDRVLWLVSPQNPLKSAQGMAPLAERLASARRWAQGPRMVACDAESRLGSRYTIDTVRLLQARFPGVRFVWLMGSDGLAQLHRWRGWTDLVRTIPIAVIARPPVGLRCLSSPAAIRFAHARRPASEAPILARRRPPAWVYLNAPLNYDSSTRIRASSPPP